MYLQNIFTIRGGHYLELKRCYFKALVLKLVALLLCLEDLAGAMKKG
jgi:hypothetical protein